MLGVYNIAPQTYVQQERDYMEAVVGLGDSLSFQISVALMVASTRDATICKQNIQCHAIEYETLHNETAW